MIVNVVSSSSGVHGTERSLGRWLVRTRITTIASAFTVGLLLVCLISTLVGAEDPSAVVAPAPDDHTSQSFSEINKRLTNPVSDLWSITFQQNNFRIDPGRSQHERWSSNRLFQPVLPVAISADWNLITRPEIPLFVSQPRPDLSTPGDVDRSTNFGDITLLQLV